MIKVEFTDMNDYKRLSFTSNDIKNDRDLLDTIGNAIMSTGIKRGSFESSDTMNIDIKDPS